MQKITPFLWFDGCAEEAVGFNQAEVDQLWSSLTAGGEEMLCGWLTGKFGVSWQIIPKALGERLFDADAIKAGNVMRAMLKMKKIHIAAIEQAYAS